MNHEIIAEKGALIFDRTTGDLTVTASGVTLKNLDIQGKLTIAKDGTLTMELLPAPATVEKDAETDAYIQEIKAQYAELVKSGCCIHRSPSDDERSGNRHALGPQPRDQPRRPVRGCISQYARRGYRICQRRRRP